MPVYSKNDGKWGWGPLVATVGVVGGFFLLGNVAHLYKRATDPFYGKCEQYRTITARQDVRNPYLRGKVVAINASDTSHEDFELQEALPADLRAARPENVGTVVIREFYAAYRGYYAPRSGPDTGKNMGPANRQCYKVSIIDLSIRSIIKQQNFCGGLPPENCPNADCVGSEPLSDVVAYLVALPRK
ncbi:MAG: hypothetical protein LAO20_17650 [Acidobacteriia bacterium]|nr:hypothetical protein [Terriglobia bacterium]